MIDSKFQKTLILEPEVINQLNTLKRDGDTYDDVINKFIQMNKKYSPILEIFEYIFVTKENSKVFRIIYMDDNFKLEFYNQKEGFIDDISAWDDFLPSSQEDKKLFLNFSKRKDFASKLYDISEELNFNYEFKISCIHKESF